MRSRRGATSLCGVLAVDKPAGMTSHDVVAAIRRATGERRVGHAGTLDPMATGLLLVLVGPYTRLEPYLSASEKAYDARIAFGAETDTDDAEGEVTRTAAVPERLFDSAEAQALLDSSLGASLQTPPAYSAIKVGGRTAHRVARAGGTVELPQRPIQVLEAALRDVDASALTWDVAYRVSKGTYIRALARDLGRAAETAAHLASLRRTASGPLTLADAHSLDAAVSSSASGDLPALFSDPVCATGLPVVDAAAVDVGTGRALPRSLAPDAAAGSALGVLVNGALAGVYRVREEALLPEAVFAGVCG
jgi:tRNA pseudouridine55 synthase